LQTFRICCLLLLFLRGTPPARTFYAVQMQQNTRSPWCVATQPVNLPEVPLDIAETEVTMQGRLTRVVCFENMSSAPATLTVSGLGGRLQVLGALDRVLAEALIEVDPVVVNLDGFDGENDFDGESGGCFLISEFLERVIVFEDSPDDYLDMHYRVRSPDFFRTCGSVSRVSFSGAANASFSVTHVLGARVCLRVKGFEQ
jgi:hypothetical protein